MTRIDSVGRGSALELVAASSEEKDRWIEVITSPPRGADITFDNHDSDPDSDGDSDRECLGPGK